MSFAQRFVPSFLLKQDSTRKQLKKLGFYTDQLIQKSLYKVIELFHKRQKQHKQQQLLKSIMKLMQQKTTYCRKLKLLCLLIQISKQTKYDVADILINKKLKLFTKANIKVKLLPILDKNSLDQYVYIELVIPFYNYLMKLSLNQELYNTCVLKQIPNDQIFRRGTKIRFIWIFKIYNLIHILIPILDSLIKFLNKFSGMKFLQEIATIFYYDMIIMNNFIIKALQQAAEDNYMLMPYFDMLQFYQSLTEQLQTSKKVLNIHNILLKYIKDLQKPQELKISQQDISQIQVQALRVKLISNSLKNPKKDHTRLQTQYNIKSQIRQKFHRRVQTMTEGPIQENEQDDIEQFKQKFKNLDLIKQSKQLSEEEQVSQQQDQDQQYMER